MRDKARLKAGIYFSHYECLGHSSRVIAVGEVFKKRFPQGSLFFIQGGLPQPNIKLDEVGKVYALPGAFMDRRHFREPIREAGINAERRAEACTDIITRQKPGLLITEFFPLGRQECRYELIPSLIKAASQGTALWAVAGYPLLTGTSHEWREQVLKLYQRIIIFSPPFEKESIAGTFSREKDRQAYLDFFEKYRRKIVFAGYLLPHQEVVRGEAIRPPAPKGVCRVAVLRGGGAYYPKMIAQAIRAGDLLGEEYDLTVVAGPATTPEEWDLFVALTEKNKIKNVTLLRSIGDYEAVIRDSDVCVSAASYHTSVMLLKHRKKAVIIPLEGDGLMSFREQPARAALLKETLGSQVLSIRDLTGEVLAAAIKSAVSGPSPGAKIPQKWFMGAEVLDQEFSSLE